MLGLKNIPFILFCIVILSQVRAVEPKANSAVQVEGEDTKKMADDKAIESLISRCLMMTKNSRTEHDAYMKLVELGDSAIPALLRRLSSTTVFPPGIKGQNDMKTLIEILSEIGTEKALPFIDKANKEAKKQLSQSRLSPDRAKYLADIWATHCKERIQIWNYPDRLELLLAALEKPYLRKWAIYKLGVLRDEKALIHLQKILDESDRLDTRESARDSLGHIESNGKVPLYYKYHRASQTFKIKTAKQIFQSGEAIPLEYELVAGEYGSQTLLRFQETKGYLLSFGVAGPETSADWRGRYQLNVRMMKPYSLPAKQIKLSKKVIEEKAVERFQLAAGEHITGKIDISKAYHLNQPGEYRVYIRISNYVSSNEIRIQIRSRTSPQMEKNASLKPNFKTDVPVEGEETNAREILEQFIAAVKGGDYDAAVRFADPDLMNIKGLKEFQALPNKRDIRINFITADSNAALAISSGLKSGRVPDDRFFFWLTRKNDAWLVRNIELKAGEAQSVPVDEFCRKHPLARMIPHQFKGPIDLSSELLDKRNQLLAKANTKIREGLVKLAERFPQLTKSRDWQRFRSAKSSATSVSRIGIYLHHSYGRKGGNSPVPVPEEDRYSVLVIVRPPPQRPERLSMDPIYPSLRLVGQIGTSAGIPELDAALKKLVDGALEPLKQLDESLRDEQAAVQVEGEKSWGEPVEGVQVRLLADKKIWQPGEIPTFKADICNKGLILLQLPVSQERCQVEVNGRWFRLIPSMVTKVIDFSSGQEQKDIAILLTERWMTMVGKELSDNSRSSIILGPKMRSSLQLPPGRCTIRVAFVIYPAKANAGPPLPPIRAVSNPVEIEILPTT